MGQEIGSVPGPKEGRPRKFGDDTGLGVYERLTVQVKDRVARVSIGHPPVNLMDRVMMRELGRLARGLAQSREIRVVVVESEDPEFFIAHADVRPMIDFPSRPDPRETVLNPLHSIFESWRTLPQVTIAKINGRARGGGAEFAVALDMRFVGPNALFAWFEISLGIIPGAGGTQYLTHLVGRGRALELLLSGRDVDASEASEYGLVNKVLPAANLDTFVDQLATRLMHHPPAGIAAVKRAVEAASVPLMDGLLEEEKAWFEAFTGGAAPGRMRTFLAKGGQTRDFEVAWHDVAASLDTGSDDDNDERQSR